MSRSRLWALTALVGVLAFGLIAAGCGGDDDDGGGGDLGLVTEGKLSVGTDTPYPPFEVGQADDPDFTGYDIDVMNEIADRLELEVDYTGTGFGTIFRDTANGQFDTAAAASDITDKREQVVDFTDPYYLSATALVVPEGSDIASVDDLGGAIVGVQDGTTQQDFAEDETDADDVRGFPEGPNAIQALVTGQVDAVLTDLALGALAVEEEGGIEIVEEIPTDVFFGFAVAPDNDALREEMNDALAEMKDDGTITELYQLWFGVDAPPEVLEGTNELLTE